MSDLVIYKSGRWPKVVPCNRNKGCLIAKPACPLCGRVGGMYPDEMYKDKITVQLELFPIGDRNDNSKAQVI